MENFFVALSCFTVVSTIPLFCKQYAIYLSRTPAPHSSFTFYFIRRAYLPTTSHDAGVIIVWRSRIFYVCVCEKERKVKSIKRRKRVNEERKIRLKMEKGFAWYSLLCNLIKYAFSPAPLCMHIHNRKKDFFLQHVITGLWLLYSRQNNKMARFELPPLFSFFSLPVLFFLSCTKMLIMYAFTTHQNTIMTTRMERVKMKRFVLLWKIH